MKRPPLQKESDLIRRFQEDIAAAGLIGEKENAAVVMVCAVSAKLAKPLQLTVNGKSAAGKNYLLEQVTAFLPPEMVKTITGMTPKALMHSAEKEYEHKAVFIAEYEGVAGADYAIRTFQSERAIQWEYVDSSGKGLRKESRTVRGPAAFIQATTRAVLHPENETRLLFIKMDESAEQTLAIMEQQAIEAELGSKTLPDGLIQQWQELIRGLSGQVKIPFAQRLFPYFPGDVRSRRDFPKLLALIEVSAFIHQHQRERQGETIIATSADYLIAKKLFEHCLSAFPEQAVSELVKAAGALHKQKGEFKVADLVGAMRMGKTRVYELLQRAEEMGCIASGEGYATYVCVREYSPLAITLPATLP